MNFKIYYFEILCKYKKNFKLNTNSNQNVIFLYIKFEHIFIYFNIFNKNVLNEQLFFNKM